MGIEKDITRFKEGDKYIKQLLRPYLEEEVTDLKSWLPEYKRYVSLNPTYIIALVQEGEAQLGVLEAILE